MQSWKRKLLLNSDLLVLTSNHLLFLPFVWDSKLRDLVGIDFNVPGVHVVNVIQ